MTAAADPGHEGTEAAAQHQVLPSTGSTTGMPEPAAGDRMPGDGAPLAPGERVLLVDAKERVNSVSLMEGGLYHSHGGVVAHDDILGASEGVEVRSERGARFVVVRPTLAEAIVSMPRGAQIVYPKDIAAILSALDVRPGCRVLEAGVGSGALSMALLRAGASVVGYDVREDFSVRARRNVEAALGPAPQYRIEIRDAYEGIGEHHVDRLVLDLPEPWRVLEHGARAMSPGGIVVCYLPSISQVAELRAAMPVHGFGLAGTFELLERHWHVEGRSLRPEHRMVAHTAFLTRARLLRRAEA